MTSIKKLTLKDWWSGKVYLNTCESVFPSKSEYFAGVDISEFNKMAQKKIAIKQKELFDKQVNNEFERLKKLFLEKFQRSVEKEELRKNEIRICTQILKGPSKIDMEIPIWKKRDIAFIAKNLVEIRSFYYSHFVNGNEMNYNFVNSPKFQYQDKNKLSTQIYVYVIYYFLKWLNDKSVIKNKLHSQTNKTYSLTSIAIAHRIMKIRIQNENAQPILKEFSHFKSCEKLIAKWNMYKTIPIKSSGNKGSDTKYYNTLLEVKELISGKNNPAATSEINRIIAAFDTDRL